MSEQQYLAADGMEPPRDKDIERAIDGWLEARSDARRLQNTAKVKHDKLMELMGERGFDRYPFTDPDTKKKSVLVADKSPHAKVMRGARARRALNENEPEPKKGKRRKKASDDENAVESRRVARTEEHDEMADPMGAVRGRMNGHHEAK